MASGMLVERMRVPLNKALDPEDFALWLGERGIWLRQAMFTHDHGEQFQPGHVYLLSVDSINVMNTAHMLLLDTRPSTRKLYDPELGNPEKKHYTTISEHDVYDFYELRDRSIKGYVML
jgi:hypothetical protein